MTPSPFFTVSLVLEALGLFLWFWGSWPLLETQPLLVRLHKLTVADALGSLLMLMGLMVQRPSWWPLFGLTMFGLLLWSTIFGYVVAAGSHRRPEA